MSPEEHYARLLSELGLPGHVYQERLASFHQALLEHDVRILEEYLYGESEDYVGGSDAESDRPSGPVKLTATRRYRLGP